MQSRFAAVYSEIALVRVSPWAQGPFLVRTPLPSLPGKLTWVLDAESAKELHVADWDLSGRKSPFHRSAVPNL